MLKKCLDKRSKMTRSGAAACVLPKCQFFEQLQFLVEKTANRPTDSNITVLSELATNHQQQSQRTKVVEMDSSTTRNGICEPKQKKSKTKSKEQDPMEMALLNQLGSINDVIKKSDDEDDEETLYCKSLIPVLKSLPLKKKRLAQLKIRELLFELEFD